MALRTGWVEKRQHERKELAWEVTYQTLGEQEAQTLCQEPNFQSLSEARGNTLGFHGLTRDISQGGLCIVGDRVLKEGSNLMLYLHHYQFKSSLVIVAQVTFANEVPQDGLFRHRAGLKILAVDEGSLDRIIQAL